MSPGSDPTWERRKLGLDLRQKYELYFVSLAFTLAGLAVQTAPSPVVRWKAIIEVGGWICLLGSGLLGLWIVSKLWRREVGVAEHEQGTSVLHPSGNGKH